MKISQPSDNPLAVSSHVAAVAGKSTPAASTLAKSTANKSTQSAGVAVSVSTLARSLDVANLGETPEVDTAKVQEVRTALSKGTYVVNPEAIADKLLSNARDMLTRNRG
jgi:negative regulator of flagellin synthesis FlgM